MSQSKRIKQTHNFIKIGISVLLIGVILLLHLYSDSSLTEAAWVAYDEDKNQAADSNKYEVWPVESRNDTSTVPAPTFEVTASKVSSTDKPYIEEATIGGIGTCQPGDTFTITAKEPGNKAHNTVFHPENMNYTSTNTDVVRVTKNKGSVVVTVVGPGVATINWTYTYQRYCEEQTQTTTETGTEENGNSTTQVITVTNKYFETTSINGELSGDINPQIERSSVYLHPLQPNDTMALKTNIPASRIKDVDPRYTLDRESIFKSVSTEVRDGYVYILVTANDTKEVGTITITVVLKDVKDLKSEPVQILVTNKFGITPSYTKFNCVNYDAKGNASNSGTTINVSSSSDKAVEWEYENEEGQIYPIPAGTSGTNLPVGAAGTTSGGLKATINGTKLVMETTAAFFDGLAAGDTSYSFIIRAKQQATDGSLYVGESQIVVTRPVQGIVVYRNGSTYPINSEQELYSEIGYTTNGNGITVPRERFVADPDVLVARISGLGDQEQHVAGTADNSTVTSYDFTHIPENAKVNWTSTNESVIKVTNSSQGANASTCSLIAAGPGKATVNAVTDDGKFVYSVQYIVRPYPQTVTMKDTEITERLGELTSKQVSLVAYVTSNDQVQDPPADTYLDDSLKWEISSMSSTNGESIGSVDQKGVLTFTGPGKIVVRATSKVDHNGFQGYAPFAVCTILIEQPVERITITNKPTEPIMTGEILALKTRIEPSNATDQSVIWSSANESIAKVDKDGKVTAVGPGSTTIRVQTNSGAKYDTCTIEVRRLATEIRLNRSEAKVSRGKKLTLLATILPEDTTDKTVTWTTSDKTVATVSDKGVVTGVKVSKDPVIITASTSNGKTAVCYVTVTEPVTGIKVSPKKKTIYVGNTFTIKKTLYPLGNDSINKNVTFKSSNTKVATVDANGKVTPKAGGKCTITCTSEDGGYIAKCTVTVKEKVRQIKLNKTKLSMVLNSSYQLKATVLRKTATNRKVTWSSSNKKVVSVSSTGKCKALRVGKAKITVTAKDGSKVKATCVITVVKKVKTLKLNKSYITLIKGYQYRTLKARVLPKSATNKKLLWTSSDSNIVSINKRTGTMFAENAGTAFVKVKTTDGSRLSRTCRVKVIDPVPIESLTISQSEITLVSGQKSQLEARVIPTNTTSGIRWMTDDESIATVSSNGMVTTHKPGTTTITAYCNEGLESQCQVTVIQMNPTQIAIEQYDQYTLAVDGAAANGTITWNSSNANVVTVTNGRIMGVKPGTAVVSATYNGKKVNCTVTVKNIP
ncbi:MAG: Ig-like domain-containing protein [Lachnospiraceae bacterium]|nr:Ig-like domain-containing protein [Lachnospiraceae bacterium]